MAPARRRTRSSAARRSRRRAEGPGQALLTDIEAIGIAEARIAPGAVAPQHVHRRHVESLYVLEGELALAAAGVR